MPKRTHSGETVPILGHHPAGILPAHLKVDLHIAPPSGDGSRPNVVAAVQAVDAARFRGRRAGKTNGRPQELSLLLRVRVVVGDDGLSRCQALNLPDLKSSVCDVLDATWSDAAISQGLRKQASAVTGKLTRQRDTLLPTVVGGSDAKDQRKRQKKQVPAGDEKAEARFSPEAPKQATPEPATKPIAAKVMGNGKDGIWMPTTFKRTKAALQLTNKFAPGCHASLPCSSRSTATYTKTLILPVDSSSPEAGEAISGLGLGEMIVGGRNIVAGWAFAHKQGPDGIISGQLEPVGRDGEPHLASRTRADLRAVLAALEYRDWAKEDGVDRLVISTASYIMAKGLTSWLREWKVRQWHNGQNIPVQNRDLWQRISVVMGDYAAAGCETSVLYTPRSKFGTKMEAAAKFAARQPSPFSAGPPGLYPV